MIEINELWALISAGKMREIIRGFVVDPTAVLYAQLSDLFRPTVIAFDKVGDIHRDVAAYGTLAGYLGERRVDWQNRRPIRANYKSDGEKTMVAKV